MAMKKVRKADTLSIHYSLFYSSLLTEQAMRLLFRKALTPSALWEGVMGPGTSPERGRYMNKTKISKLILRRCSSG